MWPEISCSVFEYTQFLNVFHTAGVTNIENIKPHNSQYTSGGTFSEKKKLLKCKDDM